MHIAVIDDDREMREQMRNSLFMSMREQRNIFSAIKQKHLRGGMTIIQ